MFKFHFRRYLYDCHAEIDEIGTDTTSTTLVYLFWELSQRPEFQDRIRAEITELDSSEPNAPPEWKTVVNLQVLDAVVKEALRLHTAAPASLWRVVPKGGRVLDGYFIPENVPPFPPSTFSLQGRPSSQCKPTRLTVTQKSGTALRSLIRRDGFQRIVSQKL
jgi:hypothetical protein